MKLRRRWKYIRAVLLRVALAIVDIRQFINAGDIYNVYRMPKRRRKMQIRNSRWRRSLEADGRMVRISWLQSLCRNLTWRPAFVASGLRFRIASQWSISIYIDYRVAILRACSVTLEIQIP